MNKDKKMDKIVRKIETLSKTVESNMMKLEAIGSLNEHLMQQLKMHQRQ